MGSTRTLVAAMGLIAASLTPPGMAQNNDVMIVFDGSNSMWGQIDGVAKIEIARGVIDGLLGEWSETRKVGLMAYGHRRRGDCEDIETLVSPAEGNGDAILRRINAVTPTGKTPLTSAIEQAAQQLAYEDHPATVVLISDGLESCRRDPCALAESLEKVGIGFTAHVVGFGLEAGDEAASLACIAENTGGKYLSAANAEELERAMGEVGAAVAEQPAAEPEPTPEYQVTLSAPETAAAGSAFAVQWSGAIHPRDYVTIVPVGAEEDAYENYFRVSDRSQHKLQAPAIIGLYEVRYVLQEEKKVLARESIEITEPEVTVSAPRTALAGSMIPVQWAGAVHNRDYVTIVPMGAAEDVHENYFRVSDRSEHNLQAPAESGLYEVRYVLQEGKRVLASQPIEITPPEVTISAPATALAGSMIPVQWTGAVHNRDYVTIVPMGAAEDVHLSYFRVSDRSEHKLQAPAKTGLYEVRYVLQEGKKVLANQAIEIGEPEVTLKAPKRVRAESEIEVSWTGTVHHRDYVTIVPMGAPEDRHDDYFRVDKRTRHHLDAPAQTGLYEVRYVLQEGPRVLARQEVEVMAEDAPLQQGATLNASERASAGEAIEVSWSVEAPHPRQRIALARKDQALFTWIDAASIDGKAKISFTMPEEAGEYEIRFLDIADKAVLARRVIRVE